MKILLIVFWWFIFSIKPFEGRILRVIDGDTLEQNQVSSIKIQDLGVKPIPGNILRVIDGDTYVLQTAEEALKIRMDGIDAPESDQDFGAEAKEFLNKYLYKAVKVIPNGVDRYGRTIGTLFVGDKNINLLMVREGFAWHYKKYSSDQELARAEEMARKEKKGLWGSEKAVAPWEWRKQKTDSH